VVVLFSHSIRVGLNDGHLKPAFYYFPVLKFSFFLFFLCASHAPTLPRLLVLFFRLLSIEEVNTADKGESICNLLFDYDLFVAT
jgi:hypothetical protein